MGIAAIHPDDHLAEELETHGLSAAELARKRNAPANRVTQILNGACASLISSAPARSFD
jgi:plasmid maintenance system antidote protein VapI